MDVELAGGQLLSTHCIHRYEPANKPASSVCLIRQHSWDVASVYVVFPLYTTQLTALLCRLLPLLLCNSLLSADMLTSGFRATEPITFRLYAELSCGMTCVIQWFGTRLTAQLWRILSAVWSLIALTALSTVVSNCLSVASLWHAWDDILQSSELKLHMKLTLGLWPEVSMSRERQASISFFSAASVFCSCEMFTW